MRRLWGHLGALVVLTSVLVVGPSSTACACSCAEPEADWPDLVFVGVVVDIDRPIMATSSADELTARLLVEQVKRGTAPRYVEVGTALEGPSCGFDFVEGNRYLVNSREGRTNLCAGNMLLGSAPEVELDGDVPTGLLALGGAAALALLAGWWLLKRREAPPQTLQPPPAITPQPPSAAASNSAYDSA
jgi:LPXTG-motif cell wall-anchored protein